MVVGRHGWGSWELMLVWGFDQGGSECREELEFLGLELLFGKSVCALFVYYKLLSAFWIGWDINIYM